MSSIRDPRFFTTSGSSGSASSPGHAGSTSRLIRFTDTVTSAPSSSTEPVGTGTSARPSTSRLPSSSYGGNMPASAVAAISASHSSPSRSGAGAAASRSTDMIASGSFTSIERPVASELPHLASHGLQAGRAARQ